MMMYLLTLPLARHTVILALLTIVLGGCSTVRHTDDAVRFELNEPVSLDVQSFGGDVTVEVDERRTDIKMIVTREALHGFGRRDAGRSSIEEIDYSTDIINTERGKQLRIATMTTAQQPELLRAHIRILAPAIRDVTVHTTGGDIRLEMIRGSLDLRTDGGRIMVVTAWPMTDPITIINNNGPIDYRVRGESSGIFDCETIGGHVAAAAQFGQMIVSAETDDDTFRGVLNEGTNPVEMRAIDGNIRIAVMADPLALGGAIWP